MGPNAPLDQQRAPQPDVFWRRSVVALAIGMAILGLLAWAVSGWSAGTARLTSGRRGQAAGPKTPSAAPAAPPFTGPSRAVATASATASGAGALAAPSHSATPKHGASPTRKTVTTAHTGDACPVSDVVISLIAAQYSYGTGVVPQFDISVVSTVRGRAPLMVGAKHVAASDQIRSRPGVGLVRLHVGGRLPGQQAGRGVPYMLHISWNRKTSVPRCRLAATDGHPGEWPAARPGCA